MATHYQVWKDFVHRQVLTFHGALVEANGKGFLLCAASGVGKTTHARLWRDHKNALILNGDRATCYEKQGTWFGFGEFYFLSDRCCSGFCSFSGGEHYDH